MALADISHASEPGRAATGLGGAAAGSTRFGGAAAGSFAHVAGRSHVAHVSVSCPDNYTRAEGSSIMSLSGGGGDEDGKGGHQKKPRKVWLHNAITPSPNGPICRYCGTILQSPNISVRKKV